MGPAGVAETLVSRVPKGSRLCCDTKLTEALNPTIQSEDMFRGVHSLEMQLRDGTVHAHGTEGGAVPTTFSSLGLKAFRILGFSIFEFQSLYVRLQM